jgi:hypothetical protein
MAAMKAMKAMKAAKAMKAMKAKRVSKIAKGSRAKVAVFLGNKEKTYTGLKKSDLVKNKVGRIVCKKASANGKKAYSRIKVWNKAVQKARKALGIKGFQAVKKGWPLYEKAKELYEKDKAMDCHQEVLAIPNWESFST